jgi:acyl-CoA dehydrogenase
MRLCIFPRGLAYSPPSDRLGHAIGGLVMNPTATRERLSTQIYKTPGEHNPLGQLQEALLLTAAAEPLEKRIRVDGVKTGRVTALDLPGQIAQAAALGIISEPESKILLDYDARVLKIINVDDFDSHELGVGSDS